MSEAGRGTPLSPTRSVAAGRAGRFATGLLLGLVACVPPQPLVPEELLDGASACQKRPKERPRFARELRRITAPGGPAADAATDDDRRLAVKAQIPRFLLGRRPSLPIVSCLA